MCYLPHFTGEPTETSNSPVTSALASGEHADEASVLSPRLTLPVYRIEFGSAYFSSPTAVVVGLIAVLTVVMMFTSDAAAAEPSPPSGDVLWLFEQPDDEAVQQVASGVDEALAADDGEQRHLIGADGLRDRVGDAPDFDAGCFVGVEPCDDAAAMAFDALDIALLVRLDVDAGDDIVKINYEMVDRRGEVASSGQVEHQDLREASFEVVASLFDAVGVVSFESDPGDAEVFVGDESVGTTPLSRQLAPGSYDYRVELEGYETKAGSFEVQPDRPHRVDAELVEQTGRLRVEGAPSEAVIFVDGEEMGRAAESVDLAPGERLIEARAEDYQGWRDTVDIRGGETTSVEVEMTPRPTFLRDVEADAIADHQLQFELGLELGGQMARFPGARTADETSEEVFGGWLDDGEVASPGDDRRFISPAGVRLGANWEGDWFGLGLLSVSLNRRSVNNEFLLVDRADGSTRQATMETVNSLQIRPMQLRARFFYENLAPFAQAGFGVDFVSMSARTDDDDEIRLRQVTPFANAELGVRYHFDPQWSVGASYRFQHHLGGGTGAAHMVGLTVGVGLQQLPLIQQQPPEQL